MIVLLTIALIGIGAVLIWAVDGTVTGVDLSTIGAISMMIGALGLATALLVGAVGHRETLVEEIDDAVGLRPIEDTSAGERGDPYAIERSPR